MHSFNFGKSCKGTLQNKKNPNVFFIKWNRHAVGSFVLWAALGVGGPELGAHPPLPQPQQVCVRPFRHGPRLLQGSAAIYTPVKGLTSREDPDSQNQHSLKKVFFVILFIKHRRTSDICFVLVSGAEILASLQHWPASRSACSEVTFFCTRPLLEGFVTPACQAMTFFSFSRPD